MSEVVVNEKNVISDAQRGDQSAFEWLVRKYSRYVYNFAYHLTGGNTAEADDLAQMTFVRAYRAIARFEGRSELKTWLHRITINLWKNLVRSQKRHKYYQHQSIDVLPTDDKPGFAPELRSKDPSALENVEQAETQDMVRAAINGLPDEERQVAILRDLEGYAYEEIAKLCGLPLGTVKSRLSRARKLLRTALEPVLRR